MSTNVFKLDLITNLPKLERIDGHIRQYKTTNGTLYPSVTTVIGYSSDKSALDEWRKRIGDQEADKISRIAGDRGTEVHDLCEKLVLNQEVDLKGSPFFASIMYNQISKVLKERMNNVRGSELFLYSDRLKVAGACDLIADFDNKKSIIDFKTSLKNKKKEWIDNYFLQACLYSMMFYERTGILHKQLVIIIAVEEENNAQVFVENVSNWIDRASRICKKFHKEFKMEDVYK